MPRVNIKEKDPVHYAKVKAEQNELSKQCSSKMTMARICPYCQHKVTILYRGQHSFSKEKCPNCGEEVTFPPVQFRIARS